MRGLMNTAPLPPPPPAAAGPTPAPHLLLLGRALRWRLGVVALLVVAWLAYSDWREWRQRTAQVLPGTAALAAQLLSDDLVTRAKAFNRTELSTSLQPLALLGRHAPFCAVVTDIRGRLQDQGCLPSPADDAGTAATLTRWLAGGPDGAWRQTMPLNLSEGMKAGTVEVQPNWALEGRTLWRRWGLLAAAAAALMLTLWSASRLVARALAPANQVLQALDRLAAGDLAVRLPPMQLRELHRIGVGFNRMAEHQAQAHRAQQQLAQHLLQAREAERRRLARELHDEMGQSLAALQAEAAAMSLMTAQALPQAAASAQAMGRTTAQLLEGLQRVLADLRPQALDRFGLTVALQSLAAQPRRRADGSTLQVVLQLPPDLPPLPRDHDVHIYRIVQEALTNALRHGDAREARIRLAREADGLCVEVVDDGRPAASDGLPAPGHGLLGMHERVMALGGRLHWAPPHAQGGSHLQVWLPLEAGTRGGAQEGGPP